MAIPTITITDGTPDTYTVSTNRGGKVNFKSGDGKAYYIDFGGSGSSISSQAFPAQVPAGGSLEINLKAAAPASTYQFRILDAKRNQCCPQMDAGPGEEAPKMIVN